MQLFILACLARLLLASSHRIQSANAIPDNADKINTESYNIFCLARPKSHDVYRLTPGADLQYRLSRVLLLIAHNSNSRLSQGICWTETAPDTRPIYAVLQLETRPHFMVTTVLNEDDDRRTVFPANPDYAYTNVANIDKFTTEAVAWAWVRFLLRGRLRPAGLAGKCCMIYWQARVAVATMYHEIVLRDEMLNMACWPERASKFTEECTEIVRSLLYHPSPVTLCEHLQFDAVEESNSR